MVIDIIYDRMAGVPYSEEHARYIYESLARALDKVRGELSEVYNQIYDVCYERDDCSEALERLGNQIDIIFKIQKKLKGGKI